MAIGRLGIRSFPKRDRALQLIARHLPSVGYRRGDTLELRFNGPIGEFDSGGAGIFATAVEAILARNRAAPHIRCRINSGGGNLKQAERIYNLLRNSGAYVHTIAEQQCDSAATLILMAGDFRQAASVETHLLLHCADIDPDAEYRNRPPRWTAERHLSSARAIKKWDRKLVNMYAERATASANFFERELQTETRLPIAIARSWGVIHCLVGEETWRNGRPYYWP